MRAKELRWRLIYIVLVLGASGCSTTHSTLGRGATASPQMFPLSYEQADRIVATAMASAFAGSPVSRVEFPNKGYQATMRFALDSHTVVAYVIPAKGRDPDGNLRPGYVFEVSASGTMPLSGGARARQVFERILSDAHLVTRPLPVATLGSD